MDRIKFTLRVFFELPLGAVIEPGEMVEVSLDDFVCKKRLRTINIWQDQNKSTCRKMKHQFNAVITKVEMSKKANRRFFATREKVEIIYHVEYDFEEFYDDKEESVNKHSHPLPDWARIHFTITCPRCGHTQKRTTQSNLGRPYQARCDECLLKLYHEKVELPIIELTK